MADEKQDIFSWFLTQALRSALGNSPENLADANELAARGILWEARPWPAPVTIPPSECAPERRRLQTLVDAANDLRREAERLMKEPGRKDELRALEEDAREIRKEADDAGRALRDCIAQNPARVVTPDYTKETRHAITLRNQTGTGYPITLDIEDHTSFTESETFRVTTIKADDGQSTTAVLVARPDPGTIYRLTLGRPGLLEFLYQAYRINWQLPHAQELLLTWQTVV
jgi:hypothetical protein